MQKPSPNIIYALHSNIFVPKAIIATADGEQPGFTELAA
jgi:hypothetical protein